jgi:hypothetical protein
MKTQNVNQKLEKMKTLQKGWNSYKADPPSIEVIEAVKQFVILLPPDRVEPSAMGGIGVTYYRNNRKAYVEFYNKGNCKIAVLLVDKNDLDMNVVKSNTFNEIIKAVQNFLLID